MEGTTSFKINIDTRLAAEKVAGLKLADKVSKPQFKKIVRSEIAEAKKVVSVRARQEVKGRDPRKAATAIRAITFKRILGGKLDIFEPYGKTYTSNYQKSRMNRPKWARGGNRAPRSERTKKMDAYYGKSRAFILRFLNSGTTSRTAGTRGWRFRGANRGFVWGSKWFENSATIAMRRAANKISERIAEQLVKDFNKK